MQPSWVCFKLQLSFCGGLLVTINWEKSCYVHNWLNSIKYQLAKTCLYRVIDHMIVQYTVFISDATEQVT